MITVLSALVPIFILILMGYGIKVLRFLPDTMWKSVEDLVYWILLPALLFLKLGNTDLSDFDVIPMAISMSMAILFVTVFVRVLRSLGNINGPKYTSILQGAIRQNTYIGLAGALPLYGSKGQALAAVGIAAVIPLVNVISMWSLARLGTGTPMAISNIFVQLIKSPIILACFFGICVNLSGIGIHPVGLNILDLIGRAALPLGLLAVGAGLDFSIVRRNPSLILLSNGLKLIIIPSLTAWFCYVLEVDPIATGVAILFSSLPSSASSYVMSRQFGGDHELMAAILTTQVIMAAISLPMMLALFG